MSSSASSSIAATRGSGFSSVVIASPSRSRALSRPSWLKISAASIGCWSLRAWPRQSLRKWTVQRCQAQPITCAIAAFNPGWASEIASCTPTSPRATRPRRNSRQNASVSASPTSSPITSRRPLSCTPCAITTLAHDPAAVADLLDLRVEEQVRVAAFERSLAERLDLLVEPLADPRDLRLRDPQPQALDQPVDLPRRDAGDIRLLHHRHERLPDRLRAASGSSESNCAA